MTARTDFTHCRQPGCAAAIVWARTESDAPMPIDAEPNPEGNLAVHRHPVTGELRCRVVSAAAPINPQTEQPGMPHWSTCKNPPRRNR